MKYLRKSGEGFNERVAQNLFANNWSRHNDESIAFKWLIVKGAALFAGASIAGYMGANSLFSDD